MDIRIKKIRENAKLPEFQNGNWMDTYVSKIGIVNGLKLHGEFTFEDIIFPNDKLSESIKIDFDNILVNGHNLYNAKNETLQYKQGDVIVLKLGFALELPKGKELHLLPRSGTFRKYGLMLTNSEGIGDDTYIGDDDEYMVMMYATRDGSVSIGERLIQIKIENSMPKYNFEEVELFGNENRGGYGTTGK